MDEKFECDFRIVYLFIFNWKMLFGVLDFYKYGDELRDCLVEFNY